MRLLLLVTILTILTIIPFINLAQSSKDVHLDNADCNNAIFVNDTVFGPFYLHGDHGNKQELLGAAHDLYCFEKEHHSAWYKIEAIHSGEFYFNIEPTNKKDDVDFLLYEWNNDSICYDIAYKKVNPIRTNMAINTAKTGLGTGLNLSSVESFVSSKQPSIYSKPLKVKRGNRYMLVVDHKDGNENSGHQIRFGYKIQAHNAAEEKAIDEELMKDRISLTVNTIDKTTGEPLDIDLGIEGIVAGKPLVVEGTHHYTYILEKTKKYTINCVYMGFMLYSDTYTAPDHNEHVTLDLKLEPIKKGSKVALYNIRFKPNTVKILQSSEPELGALVNFMEKNPTVHIEIIGHVNAPGKKNTAKAKKVSKQRAKSVVNYLADHGIKKGRIKFSGKGNAEMIYPTPANHEEERANRRVEIMVTKS